MLTCGVCSASVRRRPAWFVPVVTRLVTHQRSLDHQSRWWGLPTSRAGTPPPAVSQAPNVRTHVRRQPNWALRGQAPGLTLGGPRHAADLSTAHRADKVVGEVGQLGSSPVRRLRWATY